MGGILIKKWKGITDKRVNISFDGNAIGELAYLQHCTQQTNNRVIRRHKNTL